MRKDTVLKRIKQVAYLEGDFTTRAGHKTTYYIDKYLFETLPDILEPLAQELALLFPPSDTYDRIAAPELGAVALGTLLSVILKKPFVIVKKQPKDYGTQRLIEGKFFPSERVMVVEDILTTGGAVLRACDILTQNQLSIVGIVGVLNREEGAMENIAQKNIPVTALFSKTDLLACTLS